MSRKPVAGRSASGTVKVAYNTFWSAYNPGTGFYQLTLAILLQR